MIRYLRNRYTKTRLFCMMGGLFGAIIYSIVPGAGHHDLMEYLVVGVTVGLMLDILIEAFTGGKHDEKDL